ncbi:MAG: hypothetical protein M3416_03865 [Acidobacteriota bacterium]|nr:hypothetical protein [Acidobacteriota bacterium]
MSDAHDEVERLLKEVRRFVEDSERERRDDSRIIRVNKRTHRVRFEGETEDELTIVIEKKDAQQ